MMMSKSVKKETKENEVKKIVPSKLENAFYPIVYNKYKHKPQCFLLWLFLNFYFISEFPYC